MTRDEVSAYIRRLRPRRSKAARYRQYDAVKNALTLNCPQAWRDSIIRELCDRLKI
jgi:hypothetical protein